jgi:hypothetical protein
LRGRFVPSPGPTHVRASGIESAFFSTLSLCSQPHHYHLDNFPHAFCCSALRFLEVQFKNQERTHSTLFSPHCNRVNYCASTHKPASNNFLVHSQDYQQNSLLVCRISPGMADLVKKLKSNNIDVFLVSGGFRHMIKVGPIIS